MILFAWSGFPQYAARCVGAFVRQTKEKVVVIGTTPDVPIKGMEQLANCSVYWVKQDEIVDIEKLLGEIPNTLIVSGWGIPTFNRIADKVREAKGKVIAMNDANYRFSIKECLRALRFRLLLRRKYDAFFVPGKAGVELMRFYGVPKDKIVTGMYAADSTLFTDGEELTKRPKRMVYVGRLCERKNVRGLCKAFIAAGGTEKGWTLELYGCGEQKSLLPKDNPSIKVYDFLQPEELAKVYQNARCFVLPSFEEHWGLVVHEAALSGCVLLLSDRVGAAKDLLCEENGFSFNPYSLDSFKSAMIKVFDLNDKAFSKAHEVSLSLSKTKGIKAFVDGVNQLVDLKEYNEKNSPSFNTRFTSMDLLRGIAAFGIVGCHLSLSPRTEGGALVTSLCDFNVGLFAALAGFLMSGVKNWGSYASYIKKRVQRLVPTYLFWSVVFLAFTAAFDLLLDGGRIHPRYFTSEFWVSVVFKGGSATQLWFLACLFYAQVLMVLPFGKFNHMWQGWLWVLSGAMILFIAVRINGWYGWYPLRLLAFLITGYGIRLLIIDNIDKIKRFSWVILGVAMVVLGLHVVMRGIVPGFYRDWMAVFPVLIGAVSFEVKSIRIGKIAAVLGATSMGVYLLHPLATRGLSFLVTRQIAPPYSACVVIGEWVVAWGISMVGALLMLRLPILRRLV